jgi:phospholipid/cholesterol/gamma-HCH transport system substrate-binding protein
MKRNIIETVIGAVVLLVAGIFLFYSYQTANVGSVNGYKLSANFSGIGGLKVGDDVQISGVKVGTVADVTLDAQTYLAEVTMDIERDVRLPEDTAALITSESLLGGKYMSLEPGAAQDMLPPGGRIQYTQAPQNLEQLLGQFIFSMQSDEGNGSENNSQ